MSAVAHAAKGLKELKVEKLPTDQSSLGEEHHLKVLNSLTVQQLNSCMSICCQFSSELLRD
jgi:hypothetical protein